MMLPEYLSHIKLISPIKNENGEQLYYCQIHEEYFYKKYENLIRSKGCNKCSKSSYKLNRKKTLDEFIHEANIKHNNKYDYSLTEYTKCDEKIKIICPIHGVFEQVPYSHLQGIGCPRCGDASVSEKTRYSKEKWIEKFISVHQNKYDYSLIDTINSNEKIKIICHIHGVFEQNPIVHSSGHGCQQCGIENNKLKQSKSNDQCIKDFKSVHGDKYDYSKVEYKNAFEKVKIICKHHGIFKQRPNDHLNGNGCPKCFKYGSSSNQEKQLLEFIKSYVDVEDRVRNIVYPQEIDIFIPKFKIGIEYNGLFWHSFSRLETKNEINKHLDKQNKCLESNVQLIYINEDEWLRKPDIVKSILLSKIKCIKNTIYARKCIIKEISAVEFNNFCKMNHIQGERNSSVKIGLLYENEIVCVMGFTPHKNHEWELTRFCNKIYYNVVGGASKIFKYFIKTYDPTEILSFCDKRLSTGHLYETLGFTFLYDTKPNYRYVKDTITYSRNKFQKHKLEKLLPIYDKNLSESENMFNNKYRRMWDCGNKKYVWYKDNT